MDSVIRVAAIDDHPLILKGFRGWINDEATLAFAGGYTTVPECLHHEPLPDAVVLDIHLGDHSRPADNVRALKTVGVAVCVVSAEEDPLTVIGAIEAGADGYLRKSDNLDALSSALREAVAGEQPISPELAFVLSRDSRSDRPRLTARERDVLDYAGSGLTWERVAVRLGISHNTVKVHLRSIRAKYTRTI
jgi:DNA-binding NarL/FixJ family response regulator